MGGQVSHPYYLLGSVHTTCWGCRSLTHTNLSAVVKKPWVGALLKMHLALRIIWFSQVSEFSKCFFETLLRFVRKLTRWGSY